MRLYAGFFPQIIMIKIAFIGGGSVQWTTGLVADMALTKHLAGATVVLHDIDADALDLLVRASKRVVSDVAGNLTITSTPNRAEALRDADFVILCISVGGLAAMRNDIEIPERYGIYQSVGDTVGPGGLARGLRHIPFAVQVAREMEQLCPNAYMLNLTNPMTTICRGVTRATNIRTIGLCHEVDIVRMRHLTRLFNLPEQEISMDVAGINHLPVLLRCDAAGRDGLALLREWLASHSVFEFLGEHDSDVKTDVFRDRLAVKLSLFKRLGVLFGAGDRHVAEFLPGFLTDANQRGNRFGVLLTTIENRRNLANARRQRIEQYAAGTISENWKMSFEQMAAVMAAISGGPAGQFVVNVPNQGQIDNLPRQAVVECMAQVDALGVRPLAVGSLPLPAYGIIAAHVARQELIVEAALTGNRAPALAALMTDPLVTNPETAEPMLDELLAANARFIS